MIKYNIDHEALRLMAERGMNIENVKIFSSKEDENNIYFEFSGTININKKFDAKEFELKECSDGNNYIVKANKTTLARIVSALKPKILRKVV